MVDNLEMQLNGDFIDNFSKEEWDLVDEAERSRKKYKYNYLDDISSTPENAVELRCLEEEVEEGWSPREVEYNEKEEEEEEEEEEDNWVSEQPRPYRYQLPPPPVPNYFSPFEWKNIWTPSFEESMETRVRDILPKKKKFDRAGLPKNSILRGYRTEENELNEQLVRDIVERARHKAKVKVEESNNNKKYC